MAVSLLHDAANILIVLTILRLFTAWLLRRDPDSELGRALSFIH